MLCVGTVGSHVSAPPAVELVERHRPAVIAHADGWWYASCMLHHLTSSRHEHEAFEGEIITHTVLDGCRLGALC